MAAYSTTLTACIGSVSTGGSDPSGIGFRGSTKKVDPSRATDQEPTRAASVSGLQGENTEWAAWRTSASEERSWKRTGPLPHSSVCNWFN
jgi:hypothetical protein